MKRGLVFLGVLVVLVMAVVSGWWLITWTIPKEPPGATGTVEGLVVQGGVTEFSLPNFYKGEPLEVEVPRGVTIRRRSGGAGELREGQTISVWLQSTGMVLDQNKRRHHFGIARFIVIED
jgi:hypothetical protein